MRKILLDQNKSKALRDEAAFVYFKTGFPFLAEHDGYRPGSIHTFLGVSGGGKSTLIRSLLSDILYMNSKKKIGIILTEETIGELETELARIPKMAELFSNIDVMSELDYDFKNEWDSSLKMREFIQFSGLDILFVDNLTTSHGYQDRKPDHQGRVVKGIIKTAKEFNLPVVLIMHTKKEVGRFHNHLIVPEDVRGGAGIVQLSQFFYCMQSFVSGGHRRNFLRIDKNRGHIVENTYFEMFYWKSMSAFGKIEQSSIGALSEAFKHRDKL